MYTHKTNVEMMMTPDKWLNYPVLPLRKEVPGHFFDCACLVDGYGPTLFLTNLFSFKPDCEKVTYDSYDAILADGWEVD